MAAMVGGAGAPARGQQPVQLAQLPPAAGEVGHVRRKLGRGHRGGRPEHRRRGHGRGRRRGGPRSRGRGGRVRLQGRVGGEDGLLEPLQGSARLQSQLPEQDPPGHPVGRQGVGPAAGAVQGEHQLPAQPLLERMPGDQLGQLAHELDVAAEGELGVDAVLGGGEAELLQPHRRRRDRRRAGHVGEGGAAPQAQRPPQPVGRLPGVPARAALARDRSTSDRKRSASKVSPATCSW